MQLIISIFLGFWLAQSFVHADEVANFLDSDTRSVRPAMGDKAIALSITTITAEIITAKSEAVPAFVVVIRDASQKRYMFDVFPRWKTEGLDAAHGFVQLNGLYADKNRFALFAFRSAGTELRITQGNMQYVRESELIEDLRRKVGAEGVRARFGGPKSTVTHVPLVGLIDRDFLFDPTRSDPHTLAELSTVTLAEDGNWIVLLDNEKGRTIRVELDRSLTLVDVAEVRK